MVACKVEEADAGVGATVKVETGNGLVSEGIVISFDKARNLQMLVLDTKEITSSKPMIRIFNSNNLKNVQVVSPPVDESAKHALEKMSQFTMNNPLTGNKTTDRLVKTLGEMRPSVMKSNVPINGQQAYLQLKLTIADTHWAGENIRVMGHVLVKKPYNVDSVTKDTTAPGYEESRANTALLQVKKILSKPLAENAPRHPLDFTIGAVVSN
ncbi:unnamed protein product [Caenorhabditis nigoni]|uniref:AD domain-containing protein n=2 Tax=Caenorhabditis nigoni TaxID=1611254 RepID=A0A2G5UT49_9PELO|nr:hypothetical protein B9Z55_009690 [Caenorhabditis nigoni]